MQNYFNKTYRNRFTESLYVDQYLEDLKNGKVAMMKSVGIDVTPRDENDVFVPITKNSRVNLEEVEETMHEAYGHTVHA